MMKQQSEKNQQMDEFWIRRSEKGMEHLAKKEVASQEEVQQPIKLQNYTITKFSGDFKDWLRFRNQFMVNVDESYLLELVEDQPKDDIPGLHQQACDQK